jgi:hypothetical protein
MGDGCIAFAGRAPINRRAQTRSPAGAAETQRVSTVSPKGFVIQHGVLTPCDPCTM